MSPLTACAFSIHVAGIKLTMARLVEKEFTGSHSDRLRIGRPDEFDVDIVIRLPASDLFIEKYSPGYVRLRTGSEFSGMCSNDDHNIKQVVSRWVDDSGYLLRTEFTNWFKSVVARAINQFPQNINRASSKRCFYLSIRDSGPTCTLIVKGERNFLMSVDLVPALEFTEDKWPHDDRFISLYPIRLCPKRLSSNTGTLSCWKLAGGAEGQRAAAAHRTLIRIWRVSLHAQEKRLIHGTRHLRQAIRLVTVRYLQANSDEYSKYGKCLKISPAGMMRHSHAVVNLAMNQQLRWLHFVSAVRVSVTHLLHSLISARRTPPLSITQGRIYLWADLQPRALGLRPPDPAKK
ncbi:Cyclic GMP-AMP synthase [Eumeta japonica]|uniref:Cyclic GMP-AMP synthase n=1 Tax=Eumeta variegata TaxID=151549 RepID=A0A4C1TG09_EUMVA|nr:Cyclic GMP-AMP synthase [Eumeta japonica]